MEEDYNYLFCIPRITSRKEVERLLDELKQVYDLILEGFATIHRTSSYPLRDPLTKSLISKVTYLVGNQEFPKSSVNNLLSTWRNKMRYPPLRIYITKSTKEKISVLGLESE